MAGGPGAQPMQEPPAPPVGSPSSYDPNTSPVTAALTKALHKANLANDMDDEELVKLGEWCKRGYEADKNSRGEWEDEYDKSLKQAMQVAESKNFPWPKASNVKFPILSIAAMQFSARAYPTLIPSDGQVVKHRVLGNDMEGQKARKAEQLSLFMSWQIMCQMDRWEEQMDKLLIMLPITGTVFKRVWWDLERNVPRSELITAYDLVVNYWAKSLKQAERKTHLRYFSAREVQEKINAGLFCDILDDLGNPNTAGLKIKDDVSKLSAPTSVGEDTPYLIGDMHTFYDVDGDDYPEPVIVTFHIGTGKVLRVAARYEADDIKVNEEGKLLRIEPCEHFIKYGMFPNPTGGFYDVGFGTVLGPLNEAVDTLINQLIDSGTLANMQGGWMSKSLRTKQGDQHFRPGEWKQVNATLDDLKKGILPHQYKEPSMVLFQLLGMLTTTSRELASVSELMTGKMPGQNTPAYTTRESAEQGMKVFTACYKRVFNAMAEEFKLLYYLDRIYMEPSEVVRILDAPDAGQIFETDIDDVVPAADPQAMSAAAKAQKAQQFQQLIQMGAINRKAGLRKIMEYEEIPLTPDLLAPMEPPPPDPKMQMEQQKLQAEMQMMQQEHQFKMQEMQMELQIKRQELEIEKQKAQLEMQIEQARLQVEMQKLGLKVKAAQQDAQIKAVQGQQQLQLSQVEHDQAVEQAEVSHGMEMEHGQAAHAAKMKQAKEAQKNAANRPGGAKGVER